MEQTSFRLETSQRMVYLAAGILLLLSGLLGANLLPLAVGAALIIAFFLFASHGVDLTPEALVMRGMARQELPWARITALQTRSMMGARMVEVTLDDGTRKRLRAPITGLLQRDNQFEAKYEAIRQAWSRATGQPA